MAPIHAPNYPTGINFDPAWSQHMYLFDLYILLTWTLDLYCMIIQTNPVSGFLAMRKVALRTTELLEGFKKELDGRLTTLKQFREALETLFAQRLDDEQIELPEHSAYKQNVLVAIRNCESGFNAYAGSVKSIKAVVETSLKIKPRI